MVVLPSDKWRNGKINGYYFQKVIKPFSEYQKVRPYPSKGAGNILSTINPKTKFDNCGIGGHFNNSLVFKNNRTGTFAKAGDINFNHMWDVGGCVLRPFFTRAVFTKSREWFDCFNVDGYRKGRDLSELDDIWENSFKARFIDTLEENDVVAICDYHF